MNHKMTDYFNELKNFFKDKELESVWNCIICGSRKYTWSGLSSDVARCSCGFVWRPEQHTAAVLDDFYKRSDAMTKWADIKDSAKEYIRQNNKFKPVWQFIKDNNIKSVCDIGCGNGFFLNSIEDISKCGIELNEDAIKHCKFPVYTQMSDMPKNKKFDMVTMFGALEHFKDPKRAIENIYPLLRIGGYLSVIVPNVDSLVVRVLGDKCSTFCPQHLWYFNIDTLTKLMRDLEFGLVEYTTVEPESAPILKMFKNQDPYNPSRVHGDPELDKTILKAKEGYKIVAVFRRNW